MTLDSFSITLLPIEIGMIEYFSALTGHGNQCAEHRQGDQLSGVGVKFHGCDCVFIQSQGELVGGGWLDRQRGENRDVLSARANLELYRLRASQASRVRNLR